MFKIQISRWQIVHHCLIFMYIHFFKPQIPGIYKLSLQKVARRNMGMGVKTSGSHSQACY